MRPTDGMPRLATKGSWFTDPHGRKVLLRGVNLGGDCKVPYPHGGTNYPSDFSDHRTVSFIGRPFPKTEADEHLGRIAQWGFNCLRLLTTWEAIEHAGPGQYDEAYLDYLAEVTRKAGEHGLYVFIDFHQDVWSRMSGGDGAPGWCFEAVGLDFTKFHAAGAANVMQAKYDYARGGRQEDRYPMMSWGQNYRMPANAIMWTLFFAGREFAPDFLIDGKNVQDYLQGHYLGAMRAVAKRVKHMPHVLGFDTLNEPSTGWIGKELSYRHLERSNKNDKPVTPGPAWSALDGLLVAQGVSRTIPQLAFDPAKMKVGVAGENVVNPNGVNIWLPGRECPFKKAGVFDAKGGPLKENWFTHVGDREVDPEADFMVPFFNRVAETIRAENPDWLVFAEFDPFQTMGGHPFPQGCPERMVNASHWYDIVTLVTKTFMYPTAINPFNGKMLEGRQAILDHYVSQLAKIKFAAEGLPGGAPTLIGEFGIPFDLDGAAAYAAWAQGDRSDKPWEAHVTALELMYEAMDKLLLNTAQWNYTASNSNDLATGDGWNQEDLSIFSRDQHDAAKGKDSGGRGVAGFARPYAKATQGTPLEMSYDRAGGLFTLTFDADPRIAAPTEIVLPEAQYPDEFRATAPGLTVELGQGDRTLRLWAKTPGRTTITVLRGA